VLGEGEPGAEVLLLHLIAHLAENGGVNLLLELLSSIGSGALWGVLGEESLGSSSGGLLLVGEGLVSDRVELNTGHVHLGGGGDGVVLVDSSDWDTVDLVWTGDSNETALELLEGNNSLSSEPSGKEDENSAGLDTLSEFRSLWSVSSWGRDGVLCWVPLELSFSWFIFSLLLDHLHRLKYTFVRTSSEDFNAKSQAQCCVLATLSCTIYLLSVLSI
jgi:hypothetical protein